MYITRQSIILFHAPLFSKFDLASNFNQFKDFQCKDGQIFYLKFIENM